MNRCVILLVAASVVLGACGGGSTPASSVADNLEGSEGNGALPPAEEADDAEVAAQRICEAIEREPSNHVAYEEFTRDFDREVRSGIDETALSDALEWMCGRLVAAIAPPLETSERQALSRAEELAERVCIAMAAEESDDLAYLEFEMMIQPELASGMDESELQQALADECGDLLAVIAPVFASEGPANAGPREPAPGATSSQPHDYCPQDRPAGTEYIVCVDGVAVGMADGYCDVSYGLFEWYGVAGNFNPYAVDVVMTFELVTDSGTRTGDGTAAVWNLQPDADARFEVFGTSIDAVGASCRIADISVTRAR